MFLSVGPTFETNDDGVSVPELVASEVSWVGVSVNFIVGVVIGDSNKWVSFAWFARDGVLCRCSLGLFHAFYALPSWVGLL